MQSSGLMAGKGQVVLIGEFNGRLNFSSHFSTPSRRDAIISYLPLPTSPPVELEEVSGFAGLRTLILPLHLQVPGDCSCWILSSAASNP